MTDTKVTIAEPVNCDFCDVRPYPAKYDGKTVMGPWAYMCEDHFLANGVGLGLGKGQELIVK